jgi:hypothetical protein
MITQSDPGTENYGIANGHTYLRQWHDLNLTGTLQHCWMRQKKNVVPEIRWSQMRDDGALVLKMCWTLVCMRTGTILQIQSSCKDPKYLKEPVLTKIIA